MKYVKFLKLQNDGSQTEIARAIFDDTKIKFEGDENLIFNLQNSAIRNYTEKKPTMLTPADGLKFLEQLKYTFKSGYLNATDIIEE